uniref:Uncharacterized protein n=1 Tax=Anopheles maculatus TaxID=74869 RepID=A0A182SJA9_9DIPT
MKKYHRFLACVVLSIVTLPQPGDTNPRPDFAVPARMTGVASGSLDSTGNVVQNTNRVLNLLDQFQSITETLYGLQTPDLYRLATGFRLVLDSLVESGSPIFQGLSNAARLSSGNITTVFDGIRQSINATIALNELHQAAINGTSMLLGMAGVQNISTVLDQLVRNVAELGGTLDEIEPALVEIQQLVRPSQALVDSRYPRDGIRKLNGILLEYVNIGRSTVPQINAVVNRIRMMDGFIARLASVTSGLRNYLNGTLQTALRTIRTNFNVTVTTTTRKLKQFFLDDLESVQLEARNASGLLVKRLTNVTQSLDELANNATVVMERHETEWVMNRTIAVVTELAWRMALSVTSSVPGADSCFAKFNYEFDKIPQLIYASLVSCGQGEVRTLQSVANALVGYLGVVQAQLDSEANQYNQCLSGLVPGSSDALKLQRAVCLRGAERLSVIWGDVVVDNQLQAFEELVRDEVGYSAARHHQCVRASDQLLFAEVQRLWSAIGGCLN